MTVKKFLSTLALFLLVCHAISAQVPTVPPDSVAQKEGGELDEVVISTRVNRSIKNLPTRVEVFSGEEIEEKTTMKPSDIRLMLSETTGIMTQQTSVTSGNALIRIQGLDGRYTQILKDGFPAFAGAASGLGLLQTPPLDLRRVEVIKGSSSTLYGGGAIAGMINLISKVPAWERELTFLANGTSANGLDLNGYYGQRFGSIGTTVFAAYNTSRGYDPSDQDFSAIPKYDRWSLNPKLFFYLSPKTSGNLSLSTVFENRIGGDMHYIRHKANEEHSYFERNKTQRHGLQFTLNHWFDEESHLNVKASTTYFNRDITMPDYAFEGTQWLTFGEVNYSRQMGKTDFVAGVNLWEDRFKEDTRTALLDKDYTQTTLGAFAQMGTDIANWLSVEAGLRADHVVDYGFALLPRLSLLFTPSEHISSRLGGGMGYKAPTIFTEESERIVYRHLLPINKDLNKLERSWGVNWDINYTTGLFDNEVTLGLNHLFFYTRLNHTLLMRPTAEGYYRMENIDGHTDTRGWETNVKLDWHDFHYYFGYTFTYARNEEYGRHYENPLTPRHRLNNILMYERENAWRIGLEAYYYSPQKLSDGLTGRSYWLCGLLIEKIWEHLNVYVNFENFTDRRQTRFDTIYTGSRTSPEWRDIYAPLDGFVFSAGVKVKL